MKKPHRRWCIRHGRDMATGTRTWLLGLYWRPRHTPRAGHRVYRRYVEFRVNTSNPFSLQHSLK